MLKQCEIIWLKTLIRCSEFSLNSRLHRTEHPYFDSQMFLTQAYFTTRLLNVQLDDAQTGSREEAMNSLSNWVN